MARRLDFAKDRLRQCMAKVGTETAYGNAGDPSSIMPPPDSETIIHRRVRTRYRKLSLGEAETAAQDPQTSTTKRKLKLRKGSILVLQPRTEQRSQVITSPKRRAQKSPAPRTRVPRSEFESSLERALIENQENRQMYDFTTQVESFQSACNRCKRWLNDFRCHRLRSVHCNCVVSTDA